MTQKITHGLTADKLGKVTILILGSIAYAFIITFAILCVSAITDPSDFSSKIADSFVLKSSAKKAELLLSAKHRDGVANYQVIVNISINDKVYWEDLVTEEEQRFDITKYLKTGANHIRVKGRLDRLPCYFTLRLLRDDWPIYRNISAVHEIDLKKEAHSISQDERPLLIFHWGAASDYPEAIWYPSQRINFKKQISQCHSLSGSEFNRLNFLSDLYKSDLQHKFRDCR